MQRDLTLVFGGDGTGKTTFVVNTILPKYPRKLVLGAGFDEDYRAANKSYDLDSLVSRLGDLQAFGSQRPFYEYYTPAPDEYDLMFLLARDLGNCLIVAEEADRFNPMGYWETEYVYRGRHWGVSMVGLTIQPYGCPKDWRRILKELISFRQVEPSDIDYIYTLIGEKAYEIPQLPGPDRSHKPPFPYLRWTPSEGAIIESNGSRYSLRKSGTPRPAGAQEGSQEDEDQPVGDRSHGDKTSPESSSGNTDEATDS